MKDATIHSPVSSEWPEFETSSISKEEFRTFIGGNAGYYLEKWSPAAHGSGGPSGTRSATLRNGKTLDGAFVPSKGFNLAALVFSVLWIPYRKMYGVALIFYASLYAMNVVPNVAYRAGYVSEPVSILSSRAIPFIFAIICGMFANSWYLAHAKREIARIRDSGLTADAYDKALARRGGTSWVASLGLPLFFLVWVGLAVLIYMIFFGDHFL